MDIWRLNVLLLLLLILQLLCHGYHSDGIYTISTSNINMFLWLKLGKAPWFYWLNHTIWGSNPHRNTKKCIFFFWILFSSSLFVFMMILYACIYVCIYVCMDILFSRCGHFFSSFISIIIVLFFDQMWIDLDDIHIYIYV